MPKLTVEGYRTVDVESGKRLVLAIEQDAKVDVLHACGGNARCTTCRVEFIAGEPDTDDRGRADRAGGEGRDRRTAVVPDRLQSRHGRSRDQPSGGQRPSGSRSDAAANGPTAGLNGFPCSLVARLGR